MKIAATASSKAAGLDPERVCRPDTECCLLARFSKLVIGLTASVLTIIGLPEADRRLAATLVQRDAGHLALALKPFLGDLFADVIFGIGVLGMALSTITLLMLISGLCICEIFGLPPTGWPFRLGTLAAATGVLGPFLWSKAAFWLAVPTSVFGFTLLPIAYLTFFLLMNQKSLLGEDRPKGGRRIAWNTLMGIAAGVATCASVYMISQKAGSWGIGLVVAFAAAAIIVHFVRPPERG